MTRFRTLLFWTHLAAGLFAGAVVLVMSVTGVLLTYEKQMIWWADTRNLAVTPPGSAPRLPLDTLLERVHAAQPGRELATVTVRRDPAAPIAIAASGGAQLFVDPVTAHVLGTGDAGMRTFFRTMTDWHRWLGASGSSRSTGRAITGACNLAFLFLVLSGAYLWFPRRLSWTAFRQVLWFRRGLVPKARDFNWHNVIGVWSVLPLALIVASGVVISYPWASNLVYRAVGETPPAPGRPPGGPAAGGPATGGPVSGGPAGRAQPGAPGRTARAERPQEPRGEVPQHDTRHQQNVGPLEPFWSQAAQQVPEWRSIAFRVPASSAAPLVFTIDAGTAGQPHKRGQLTVSRTAEGSPVPGAAARWEPFASQTRGRQLRSFLRFAHTGEVAGLIGQTIAGLVSLGSVVLVYSGIALTLRRFAAWRRRRRAGVGSVATEKAA